MNRKTEIAERLLANLRAGFDARGSIFTALTDMENAEREACVTLVAVSDPEDTREDLAAAIHAR